MAKIFPNVPIDGSYRMHSEGNDKYWFFHHQDFPSDPPQIYMQLIGQATSSIDIWDPYFNISSPDRNQDIFDQVGQDITIRLLTQKGLSPNSTYFSDIANAVKSVIPPAKNTRLGLRAIDKGDNAQQQWQFHDRFLIVDSGQVYLVGASITWHLRAVHSTGIYRITDPDTKDFLLTLFENYWNRATSQAYTIRYLHT